MKGWTYSLIRKHNGWDRRDDSLERKLVIDKEDYVEPNCLLCGEPYGKEPAIKAIPQQRVMEKVDEYMSKKDYAGVERHLLYWLEEARLGHDLKGELMVQNELIGHYRKTGDQNHAFQHAEETLKLLDENDFSGMIAEGTTYVNIATVFNAFDENEKSLNLFEKARSIYESIPTVKNELLGGLYNNMALGYAALNQFQQAYAYYHKALEKMKLVEHGELEQAITYLNLAETVEKEKGQEEAEQTIEGYLDQAMELLDTPSIPRNGYYAFVCEKCAPSFSYYGYFLAEQELKERAKAIYERA